MYAPPANIANPSISTSTTDLNTLTLQLQSIGNTLGSPSVRFSKTGSRASGGRRLKADSWCILNLAV